MNRNSRFRKLAEPAKRFASTLLVILFVISVSLAIISHVSLEIITDSQTYHTILEDAQVARRSKGLLANLIVSFATQSSDAEVILEQHSTEVWDSVADVILDVDWLDLNLRRITDSLVGWLLGDDSSLPDIRLDLTSPKLQLLSPQGSMAMLPLLQTTPLCPEGITEIIILVGGLVSCLPENADITGYAQNISTTIAGYVPDKFSLAELSSYDSTFASTIEKAETVHLQYRAIQVIASLFLRFSLVFLSLYTLLHSSSLEQVIQSLARPIYWSIGILFFTFGGAYAFLQFGVDLIMTSSFPMLSNQLRNLLLDTIDILGGMIVRDWLLWVVYFIIAAIILQLIKFIYSKSHLLKVSEAQFDRHKRIRKVFR